MIKMNLLWKKVLFKTLLICIKEEKIPSHVETSGKLLEEIKSLFEDEWITQIGLPTFNNEIAEGLSLSEIRLKYDEIYAKSQNKMRSLTSAFNELRKDYIVTYKLSYDITKEDNDDFEND